jgi:1-acyl-sn-glycerol-3-phosphate acyltransferase
MRKIRRQTATMEPTKAWDTVYHFIRPEAAGLMRTIPSRVIYHGLENLPEQRGVLFVGNHQSYFDIPVLLACMEAPTAFVAKDSLGKVPLVGPLLRMLNCVLLNRDDLRQGMEAIRQTSDRLKAGLNMVIFPEGTRSRSDTMGEFKKGSLKAATMASAPIVPFRLDGTHALFESNRGFRVKSAEVHVYFGEPIDTASLDRAAQKQLAGDIRDIVCSMH